MLLELISRRMTGRTGASNSLHIDQTSDTGRAPLRLVEFTKPVASREKTRRAARKSEAIGGRAFVLHPDASTRTQFDLVLGTLGFTSVDFDEEDSLARAIELDEPDIVLWGMGGDPVGHLSRIRELSRGRSLPIVVVATLGEEVTLDEVQDAGASDLIFLPLPCHRLAPALSLALLRHETLELLAEEHTDLDSRGAARGLVWRAAKVWSKRRGTDLVDALRHVLARSRNHGHTLTRTAMEVVAEGLFP
jgi:AmiR/NasT family two-component response regulator